MTLEKHSFKMQLNPGMEAEYRRRHDEIWPEPPRIEMPPSTTMVTTSSSQHWAIDGRVEPRREVRQT
ncbi:L-rhamnose mutarotase, partial [Rhizobium johnstonii]